MKGERREELCLITTSSVIAASETFRVAKCNKLNYVILLFYNRQPIEFQKYETVEFSSIMSQSLSILLWSMLRCGIG